LRWFIGATATAVSGSIQKQRYVPDALDIDAVKRIKLNEVELTDRNTVLRGTKQSVSRQLARDHKPDHISVEFFLRQNSDRRQNAEVKGAAGAQCRKYGIFQCSTFRSDPGDCAAPTDLTVSLSHRIKVAITETT
jgi:hypothetical protein